MTVKKAIGLILVVALLIAGGLYLRQVEHADQENMRDLYSMVEPLQRERESLAKERDQLETDYALEMRDVGTVELLFRELDRRIFSDVYPLMRDRGIIGVLGISNEEYPGLQSKLSLEQYNRLLMDGWGSCFLYDRKPTEFREWYNNLAHHLEHDKLPVPITVFFLDNSNYDSEMDEVLVDCGIRTIVFSTEDGHSSTVSTVGDKTLWPTGAMPWNYTGVNRDTEILARTNGANLAFTVGFKNLWDAFEKVSFTEVLDNWSAMLKEDEILQGLVEPTPTPAGQDPSLVETAEDQLAKPQLKVMTFEGARVAHEDAEWNNLKLERELSARQSELDQRIADLDAEIRALYDGWSSNGK